MEEETKRDSLKVPKPCSLYLSYCKNCTVVHKAIKMLPQPPFYWGILTDGRHKFYRIQISFCVASCLNCVFECWLTASFFFTCCCRQTVTSPFSLSCSTFHRLFKYWPPPCHPPTLLSYVSPSQTPQPLFCFHGNLILSAPSREVRENQLYQGHYCSFVLPRWDWFRY